MAKRTKKKTIYKKMEDLIMNKMRVWWIPQVGVINEAFHIPVQSVEEGKKVMDTLAAYDAYQVQNRIKPDYCNVGGLEIYNPETEEYEDWYFETEDGYCDDVDEYLSTTDDAEYIDSFTSELFEQIDWKKIDRMTNKIECWFVK